MRSKGLHSPRIDTLDLQSQIIRKLGRPRAEKYFLNLKRFLNLRMTKAEFDKSCHITMGRENIKLHNTFLRSILKNACLSHSPPIRDTNSPHSLISKISNGSFAFTSSPSQGKIRPLNTIDRKIKDRQSPRIPSGSGSCDIRLPRDRQSGPELISVGSKAPLEIISVEDGEEVEQTRDSSCVESRSPIRAPLGISIVAHSLSRKPLSKLPHEACERRSELLDTSTLRNRMEKNAEIQGLRLSDDSATLLNTSLDAFLKRLIKPCIDLARSRTLNGNSTQKDQSFVVSLLDFRVAMDLKRKYLGEDGPSQLEKISIRSFEG